MTFDRFVMILAVAHLVDFVGALEQPHIERVGEAFHIRIFPASLPPLQNQSF